MPKLLAGVDTRTRNARTVAQALPQESWVRDVQAQPTFTALLQMVHLRHTIATVQRNDQAADEFA